MAVSSDDKTMPSAGCNQHMCFINIHSVYKYDKDLTKQAHATKAR